MRKIFSFATAILFAFATASFAQEAPGQEQTRPVPPAEDEMKEAPQDCPTCRIYGVKAQEATVKQAVPQDSTRRNPHNFSIEYDWFTVTDLVWAISSTVLSIFNANESDDFMVGAISVNYGYEVDDVFETGLIFNFAKPSTDIAFFTLMPRAKFNFNSGKSFNPYMELDFGIIANQKGVAPMGHLTLLGFEISHFYIQLLGWGQRGLFYAGLKF